MPAHFQKSFYWTEELMEIERAGLLRSMPEIDGTPGRIVTVDGNHALNFSSNNYLGLAANEQIMRVMEASVAACGAGSTASRLIVGNNGPHRKLENYIAEWKGTEKSIVFGSGYQANVGVITALTDHRDLIVSDQLNHASIIDGCRLSRSKVIVYPHLDVNAAEEILRNGNYRRRILITESVFSMDGDFAPLRELQDICQRYGAFMMVDEAHASGVLGPQGKGLASELGVTPEIQMGTLGKALGVAGAYVAGSKPLVDLLVNKARSFIYTTAQPPAVLCAAREAVKIVASDEGDRLRRRLQENVSLFNRLISPLTGNNSSHSHIAPIPVGDSRKTMEISRACLAKGIFVQGIRYPTVPEGSARLRLTLMSSHSDEDIQKAVSVLTEELTA